MRKSKTRRWIEQAILGAVVVLSLLVTPALGSASAAAELPTATPLVSEPAPSYSSTGASDISAEKVSQFVQAYLKVLALLEQREGELQGAETESEFLRVQQEIEAAAFAAIESCDLTEQEYLQLLGLANLDPEFGERIAAQLQEALE